MRRNLAILVATVLALGLLLPAWGQAAPPLPPFAAAGFDPTDPCQALVQSYGVMTWQSQPGDFCGPTSSPSPSSQPSAVPSASPSVAPSPSPSPSAAPSVSPSPSVSASPSSSPSPVASPSPSPTTIPSPQPTPVPSPTPSPPPGALIVGSGGQYATIQAAVNAATAGQTIRVKAGIYPEQVTVGKTLTIMAYGDGGPWIDGGCARVNGLVLDGDGIQIRGLGVRDTIDAAILIHGARATIDGNAIQDFDCQGGSDQFRAGVAAWYAGPGQTVTNNTITGRVDLPGGNATRRGNGIWFKNDSAHPSGGGHLIAGNRITGAYDGIGGESEGDPRGAFDRDTMIRQNTIDACYDDGIQIDGGTQNVHVEGNTITRCADGVSVNPNWTGPAYIERNTITQGVPGFYGNLNCFKVGKNANGTAIAYYTGNRCILPAVGGVGADGWSQTNSGQTPIVARGNTIVVSRYVVEIAQATADSSFDGDCLWTSDPTRFVKWSTGTYPSLAAWRAATGQETNGQQSATCGQ